jgi:hypothetical protein
MVSRCEDKLDSRNFKVDVKKLAQQLEAPLNFTVNGQPVGTTLLAILLQHLPQEKTVHFEALKQAWKKGVTQIQAETVVEQLWQDIILHPNAPHGVQQSIADFFTNAPTLDEFVSALEDSRYFSKKRQLIKYGETESILVDVAVEWLNVRMLLSAAVLEIVEELGFERAASMIAGALGGGDVQVNREGGLLVRPTDPMTYRIALPIKLISSKENVPALAVPSKLVADSIKFRGDTDGFYEVEILRVYTTTEEPILTAPNTYRQRLMIATVVKDAPISTAVSAALLIGTEVTINKHPRVVSVDFAIDIESSYNTATDSYTIRFVSGTVDAEQQDPIIRTLTAESVRELELKVHE